MKIRKIVLSFYLMASIFLIQLSFPGSVHASINETPILLKVDDYYVLYTTPKSPYIDAHNRFMIPLRSISELLGAEVEYNPKTKIANIKLDSKTVAFQINSKIISVDGKKDTMDTVPVLYNNSMFIPLGILINHLGVQHQWDQANKLYKLTGNNLMKTDMIKNIEDLERQEGSIKTTNAFMPESYTYDPDKNTIMITSRNITGTDLPKGKEDVHPYFIFDNSYQFDDVSRERSAVKKGESVTITWTLSPSIINNKPENLHYVLVKGRMLN